MINVLELCEGAKVIGITGHVRPDGDCVGSTLALCRFLKNALKEAEIEVVLQKPSEVFSCIAGFDAIIEDKSGLEGDAKQELVLDKEYDVFFVCDSVFDRTGGVENYVNRAKKTINIDHHISNLGCGDYAYIIPEASSASELVYDVIKFADPDGTYMDEEIAKAIYLGIVHDTGVFQYSNTSPKTLRIVAELMEYGFDFSKLIDVTFYEKTYVQSQIMGRALLESIRFMDGQCIVSMIDKETMKLYGVTSKDFDGIVNQLRIIKDVECAIFMYEADVQQYKVSLRSCGRVDVSKVASYFGGGGHVRASGCCMTGTFHDVVNNLSEQIALQIGSRA